MQRARTSATGAILLCGFVSALSAQTRGSPPTPPSMRPADFLGNLKRAVDEVDRQAVAAMAVYPVTVLASPFSIPVKDRAAFVKMYDSFLTPELRCAVMAAELPTANLPPSKHTVIISPDGLLLAEGAIWARVNDGRFQISRIRVMPKAPSVEGRKAVERVAFEVPRGERTATFAGWLVRQNLEQFLVSVRHGETLQARIEGFRGHDAAVQISPSTVSSRTAGQRPPDTGRVASVVAPTDADYRIDVAHLARFCDPPQRYKLTVTVR